MRASVHTGSFLRSTTAPPAAGARIPAGELTIAFIAELARSGRALRRHLNHANCRGPTGPARLHHVGRHSEAPPSALALCHSRSRPRRPARTIATSTGEPRPMTLSRDPSAPGAEVSSAAMPVLETALFRGSRCPTRERWPSLGATAKPACWSTRLPPGTLVPMQTRGLPGTARVSASRRTDHCDHRRSPRVLGCLCGGPAACCYRTAAAGGQADRRLTDARTVQQARSTVRPESRCRSTPTMCCAGGGGIWSVASRRRVLGR